jgi:hypothetical protein
MRSIRFMAFVAACLLVSACIEIKDDNGYWDKAMVDPALVGDWITIEQDELVHVTNQQNAYLEAFDTDKKLIAQLKSLTINGKTYLLSRTEPDQLDKVILLTRYELNGNTRRIYVLDATNAELNKTFFPRNTDNSEYVRSVEKLDEATLMMVDKIFAQADWVKLGSTYQRCDARCVTEFINKQKEDAAHAPAADQ